MEPKGEYGTVVFRRQMPKDIKMRDLYLEIDDDLEETLEFGDSLEVELPAGEHRAKATNRMFSKSKDFTLGPGDRIVFDVGNIPSFNPLTFVMLITGTMPYKVVIHRRS